MHIIINSSSMVPIYEQIVHSVKKMIASGKLQEEEALPSVRSLAKELKISALTVKKAYDQLEADGFTVTVHGKGTYVKNCHPAAIHEEQLKEVENDVRLAWEKAGQYGITMEEFKELIQLVMEE